jgi:protein gp37
MGERTGISWTDHTFNPWWGCTKVAPPCDFCYAETFDKRVGGDHWGPGKPRRLIKDWSGPGKWNRQAEKDGLPHRTFCASMADVFDNEVPDEWRVRLWDLVRECSSLHWQFLTKRIGNARKMLPADWSEKFGHCGLVISCGDQGELDRDAPKLAVTPAAWRGVSWEPALGPLSIQEFPNTIDWLIAGAESGHHARSADLAWFASAAEECREVGVAFFMKQMVVDGVLRKNVAEFPAHLQIQEFP